MKSSYKVEDDRPTYDEKITEWLHHKDDAESMTNYNIGLYHAGYIYRAILCRGLNEYMEATNFLDEIGLANALPSNARYQGYDALFAPNDEAQKLKNR